MTRAGFTLWAVLLLGAPFGQAGATSLDHAGRLLVANDTAGARAAVDALVVTTPQEEAEALWILALSHMREDAPRAALPHLERLVTLAPDVPRFRLELARALFLVEQDDRARFHFESALAGQLALPEIQAVNQYLDAIEKRKSWQGHVTFAFVPQSNPTRASAETEVLVGNVLPIPLAQARKDMGLDVGLGVTWLPKLSDDWRARLHVMGTGSLYRDDALNRFQIVTELGVLHLGDQGAQVGGGIALQAAFGDSGRIMQGVGVYATVQQRFGARTQMQVRVSADRLTYPGVPQMDGMRYAAHAQVQHILSPQLRVDGALSLSRHNAQADFNKRSDVRLRAGVSYALPGGVTTGLSASLGQTRFGAPNPLLPQYAAARDTHLGLTATFLHRDFTVQGFAPVLEIGAERQSSNIPMRAFSNLRASIGASRNF
ncbi:MAG: surface lipoprotein assembly modifier [Roseinatronobacter sp.]